MKYCIFSQNFHFYVKTPASELNIEMLDFIVIQNPGHGQMKLIQTENLNIALFSQNFRFYVKTPKSALNNEKCDFNFIHIRLIDKFHVIWGLRQKWTYLLFWHNRKYQSQAVKNAGQDFSNCILRFRQFALWKINAWVFHILQS